jgi:hypothetical protein
VRAVRSHNDSQEGKRDMSDWPRCPNCGDYALDGQSTCGRPWCDEVCRRGQSEKVTERIHVSGRRKPFWQECLLGGERESSTR